jgi:serpin B
MQLKGDDMAVTVAAGEAFAVDLYGLLAEDQGNTVFSPASISAALRMALDGARGQTAAELAAALHLSGADDPDPLAGVLRHAPDGDDSLVFRAPNTIWVQSGLPLHVAFTHRLREGTLAQADFEHQPENSRHQINRAIAEQTAEKITGLVPPDAITHLTRLVLANAVYLKATWLHEFPERATRAAPFYPGGGDRASVTVPMMHATERWSYRRGDGYQAVLLPYRASALAMAVVLPDGPLAGLAPVLATGMSALLAGAELTQVRLSLPQFKITGSFGLIPALRRLGVVRAFDRDQADFSGITDEEHLHIGAVAHKAYVAVDEHGTEAAAATAAVMFAAAAFPARQPVTMTVDRPFLFAILDTATGTPLFLGQVTCPDC